MGRTDDDRDAIAARWRDATRVVVLTGAGISTASGIPDFRSPGGRWSNHRPVVIQDFLASESSREEYWRYKGETWKVIREAQPNPAHRALTELAAAGRVALLVTQNVDGLHARSGFPMDRLIHVHGTDAEVVCVECGRREAREGAQRLWEDGTVVPRCACGGPWKPATISFGQSLVEEDLERSFRAAASCDLFLAIGTSLVVGPINELLPEAQRAGAATAILTASETPFDAEATWKLETPLEITLPEIASSVLRG